MKIILVLLIALSINIYAVGKASNAKFLKPDEAIAKMDIPDGFKVTTFVAEPDIGEAIAFCFDDKGRLWTLENQNYNNRRNHTTKKKKNRIQIFEDTDGDGVFDKKKLFIDGLGFSSGLAVGHGGVYVGSPPALTFIPDVDGDDQPDSKPQILLDGWGLRDRHETLNSFIWGPDGWLYGCHGVFTESLVGKPGTAKEDRLFIDGGIWRFHPIRKEFEVFARGLSNPWGFDFNDLGEGFATCCVIPHLFHIIQGGVYDKQAKKNINPYVYDNIKTIRDHKHKSAHGGARFYLADAFPKKYRNSLFMCNIHEHSVLTDIMKPKGSGYVGTHGEDFMPTNDKAWVGFSVETGPEGAVYILDWHDQDICGASVRFPNSGRVYRIFPKDKKGVSNIDLRKLSDEELVELQRHSNDWYVRHARTILHERAAAGKLNKTLVHRNLNKMLKSVPGTGKRLRALWALHVTDGLTDESLLNILQHEDPMIRAWAVQLLCEQKKPSKQALSLFLKMARGDKSPKVRLYLAAALQRLPFEQRWSILEGLASHGEDKDDHNISKMLWLALEPMVEAHASRALNLAVNSQMPRLQEFVPRRMMASINTEMKASAEESFSQHLAQIAPGFKLKNNNDKEAGHFMKSFRNKAVIVTHPLNRKTAASLHRQLLVPAGKKTILKMQVSHRAHADWELKVRVNGKVIAREMVSSKTVKDGWLTKVVDLSSFAGRKITLSLENSSNNWQFEHGYWSSIKILNVAIAEESVKKTKVVFLSGFRSHGRMKHEHRAANILLAKRLQEMKSLDIEAVVNPKPGYPADTTMLDGAATVVIFTTGHRGHMLNAHLDEFDALMKKGVGVVMIHWATEAVKGKPAKKFLEWMGGFCDLNWSVNPHWKPNFKEFPKHPICNGVQPFSVHDEWYYHMRFVADKKGITSILAELPPASTLKRKDGSRSGNPAVRKAVANGEKQTVAWAYERPTGGRGFGFTGGHNHQSWQDDGFRKIVLNAIVWTAGLKVPKEGVVSTTPDDKEIKMNLD